MPHNGRIECDLASAINSSTRDVHTRLNQKILSLLPLALPPYTQHARLYGLGMLSILPIYVAIESALHECLSVSPELQTPASRAIGALHLPIIARGPRLRRDVARIVGAQYLRDIESAEESGKSRALWQPPDSRPDITAQGSNDSTRGKGSMQPSPSRRSSHLAGLLHRIETSEKRPHVLLAYAHIFYLALFSGGRYIQAQLRTAEKTRPGFFSSTHLETEGDGKYDSLSFWTFDSSHSDGEDIKAEFQSGFHLAAAALDAREQEEVVEEAKWVMNTFLMAVDEIAGRVEFLYSEQDSPVLPQMRQHTEPPVNLSERAGPFDAPRLVFFRHLLPLGLIDLLLAVTVLIWRLYCSSHDYWLRQSATARAMKSR